MQQSEGSPAWRARRGIPVMEEEEELVGGPTDLQVKTTVSFATPPATAPPATVLPVTARLATATQATREETASVATPASPQWTATDFLAALCSPLRKKMKMRRVPSNQYLTLATHQRARRWVGQEEREGREGGRRSGEVSRGSRLWRGPATGTASVR